MHLLRSHTVSSESLKALYFMHVALYFSIFNTITVKIEKLKNRTGDEIKDRQIKSMHAWPLTVAGSVGDFVHVAHLAFVELAARVTAVVRAVPTVFRALCRKHINHILARQNTRVLVRQLMDPPNSSKVLCPFFGQLTVG